MIGVVAPLIGAAFIAGNWTSSQFGASSKTSWISPFKTLSLYENKLLSNNEVSKRKEYYASNRKTKSAPDRRSLQKYHTTPQLPETQAQVVENQEVPFSVKKASLVPCGVWVCDGDKKWRVVDRRQKIIDIQSLRKTKNPSEDESSILSDGSVKKPKDKVTTIERDNYAEIKVQRKDINRLNNKSQSAKIRSECANVSSYPENKDEHARVYEFPGKSVTHVKKSTVTIEPPDCYISNKGNSGDFRPLGVDTPIKVRRKNKGRYKAKSDNVSNDIGFLENRYRCADGMVSDKGDDGGFRTVKNRVVEEKAEAIIAKPAFKRKPYTKRSQPRISILKPNEETSDQYQVHDTSKPIAEEDQLSCYISDEDKDDRTFYRSSRSQRQLGRTMTFMVGLILMFSGGLIHHLIMLISWNKVWIYLEETLSHFGQCCGQFSLAGFRQIKEIMAKYLATRPGLEYIRPDDVGYILGTFIATTSAICFMLCLYVTVPFIFGLISRLWHAESKKGKERYHLTYSIGLDDRDWRRYQRSHQNYVKPVTLAY